MQIYYSQNCLRERVEFDTKKEQHLEVVWEELEYVPFQCFWGRGWCKRTFHLAVS